MSRSNIVAATILAAGMLGSAALVRAPAPVSAQSAPKPVRWEYKIETGGSPIGALDFAGLGRDGWELCGAMGMNLTYCVFFKRKLPD